MRGRWWGLCLTAFFWPTELSDGMGVVNFQFAWAMENLSWSAIPLMVWPSVAGRGDRYGVVCAVDGGRFWQILCLHLVLVFLVGAMAL